MNTEKIYALMLRGSFVYVGRSINPRARASAHRARGIRFDSLVLLADVPTGDSERVETEAIKLLSPSKNKRLDGRGTHSKFQPTSLISVYLPENLRARLNRRAALKRRTPTALARIYLEGGLNAMGFA